VRLPVLQETWSAVHRLAQRLQQQSFPGAALYSKASHTLSTAAGKGSTPLPLQSQVDLTAGQQRGSAQPLDLQAVQPDSLLQALQQVSEALVCELYQGIKLVKQRHWQDLAAAAAAAVRHDDRSMSSTVPGGSEGPGDDVASATVGDAIILKGF